jgi:UDP-N-acetylglucosamine/UDP-N-acetylgalactosamine diphosphorylase
MTQAVIDERLASARQALEAAQQDHVLTFFDQLHDAGKDRLLAEIESIDWPEVARLVRSHVLSKPLFTLPEQVEPAPWYPNTPADHQRPKYEQARQRGEELIRARQVAAFTVAGGQGTRLGWDAPKGTFPATPLRHLPLFALFAEYLHKVQSKYDTVTPWYIMTSPINDADTRAFFHKYRYFGLDPANVMIFPQQMMPALDLQTGKVLLSAPDALALSPNGHGGSLKALATSGALADMQKRGVQHISYIQVDNPLVKVIDPLFLGLHDLDRAQMSSKMLPKREALEKLGNFCLIDRKVTVIEYSDLPEALARQTLPDGALRFRAGSIAIHALRTDFVASLNDPAQGPGFRLPFHRAEKKVPFLDLNSGALIKPDRPNAVKLETFVFDALPLADVSIIYETDRLEEFAPIKNADAPAGQPEAPDSPASSRRLQTERNARWLEQVGIDVPRLAAGDNSGENAGDGSGGSGGSGGSSGENSGGGVNAILEISPITAIEPNDLDIEKLPARIKPGEHLVL